MPNAARLGDFTSHGGIITGPGSPTVMIGGMPAATVGDVHVCPLTQPAPHLSTPFPSGSNTVLIEGKPALRSGDTAVCGATVVIGCPTVMIGK